VEDPAEPVPLPQLQEVRLTEEELYALTGETIGLPIGATPATLQILAGLAAILLGLTVIVVMRRGARRP
jgi:hypothetical protein